jgi:molybdopterin/thiamine biosynthesis adenylyltransferase
MGYGYPIGCRYPPKACPLYYVCSGRYGHRPTVMESLSTPSTRDLRLAARYSRQVLFPGIGAEGQQRLAAGHVAVVGCGATGAAATALLARAGVGTLTIIDRDFVEESNLQRQVLFDEADAGEALPKAEAARRKIAAFNSETRIHAHVNDLVPANIHELLASSSIVLDATDNFETRYLLNDYAVQQQKPWIYTAAVGAYAATMNILPGPSEYQTACLACIFPSAPSGAVDTCDTAGILNTAVNLSASIAVTEVLKFLTGQQHLMRRTLLSHDLWRNEHTEIAAGTPRKDCNVCGQRKFIHLAGEDRPQITLCGRNSVQIHEHNRPVDLNEMKLRLAPHGHVRANSLLLRLELPVRNGTPGHTITLFPDGRALIQGTTDVALARSLYARYIGS